MKKITLLASLIAGNIALAQGVDTTRIYHLEQISVTATRANATTPVAYSNITKGEISKNNFGQDIPFLITMTPSAVATSDAGNGIGYTSIRLRGSDASRINITVNGVPMNDAESHNLFWVNMPDFASSVEDIQIQRGVGTSTSGAGAFGGSINMRTENIQSEASGEILGGYGSFNTHREMIKVGTGLINNHWAFNLRLSNQESDGYIDRANTKLRSYFAQLAYYGKSSVVKFITFTGKEQTYHAWSGISQKQLDENRRYNPSGEIENENGDVVGFYKDQTDNYLQQNYQLVYNQRISDRFDMNLTAHYTDGYGYYEEYKNGQEFVKYGLKPFTADGATVEASNLIRRKLMDNGFGGAVFSVNYKADKIQASLGGGANRYGGTHWGEILWVQNYVGALSPNQEYYKSNSTKWDGNIYLRVNYNPVSKLNIYADAQYRGIVHTIKGNSDKWDDDNGKLQALNVDRRYNFFNPKAGAVYTFSKAHEAYASVSVAHKEPTRNNFTDAPVNANPRAERLIDYEAGYNFSSRFVSAKLNLYYMDYKDQLVLTGRVNDIGEAIADNIEKSYRMGIEASLAMQLLPILRWDLNATLARNRIKNYVQYADDWDNGGQKAIEHGNTNLSFSPSMIANSVISVGNNVWRASLISNYVSKQYMTNDSDDNLSLKEYFINNIRLNYTLPFEKTLKNIDFGVSLNNIFDVKYVSNGWGYAYMSDSKMDYDAGYFAQAGFNVMANVTIRF